MRNRVIGKTGVFISMFLLLFSESHTQLVVALQVPASGVTQKSQLWNMTLVNPTAESMRIQIELSLFNSSNNQKVLSAVTKVFAIDKGAKQIQYADLLPVNYNFLAGTDVDRNPYGLLPVGYYKACYSFSKIVSDMASPVVEECTELEVAPLSPPQLVFPEDKARVEKPYPQFTWTAPQPQMLFRHLNYTLKVVEWLPGQGYAEAIQHNMPVLQETNLKQTFFEYPASSKAFEKNKKYVWQVTATDDTYSVSTDVWLFERPDEEAIDKRQSTQHVLLERGVGPVQFISNGLLKFKYINEETDTTAPYQIFPLGAATEPKMKGGIKLRRGENFIDLSIEGKKFLKEGETYCFQLTNSAGEKWFLPFIYYSNREKDGSQ